MLFDIYSAGESAIDGVSSESLANAINVSVKKVQLVNEQTLEEKLNTIIRDGDVILMQGAGSIGQYAINLMHRKIA